MPRIPYYDTEAASGKHAEFLAKLNPTEVTEVPP